MYRFFQWLFLAALLRAITVSSGEASSPTRDEPEQQKKEPRTAFVTIVDGDAYAIGATVLSKSFRATSSIPPGTDMMVIVPHGGVISKEAEGFLMTEGGYSRVLQLKENSSTSNLNFGSGRDDMNGLGLTKSVLFALNEYDRILYLDADAFAVRRVPIFDNPDYWRGNITGIAEADTLVTTLKGEILALRPDRMTHISLIKFLDGNIEYKNADRKLFNKAFREEWIDKPQEEIIPRSWQLCAAYCVLAELKPEFQSMYDDMLQNAIMFDFQGKAKPWKWPTRIGYRNCQSLVPWLNAWIGIAYAPDLDAVRAFLATFNADRVGTDVDRMSNVVGLAHVAYKKGTVDMHYYNTLSELTSDVLHVPMLYDKGYYGSEFVPKDVPIVKEDKQPTLNAYPESSESGFGVYFKFD